MARKETEGLVEMFLEMEAKQELIDRQERINKRIDALKKELKEISNRAYQAAVGKVVAQYQEKMSDESLPVSELEKIAQERKEFEANPEKYGITLEKSPIVDENDQKRALQIVELLKNTDGLDNDDLSFDKMIEGYAERHKQQAPVWMQNNSDVEQK